MIGDFRYSPTPRGDEIILELYWDKDERMGRLRLPDEVANAITIEDLPGKQELPVISALSFAVFIAGQSRRRLCLSGDTSVWEEEWGRLIAVN